MILDQLISDEHLQRDYEERGIRLSLTCCVCQTEGWAHDEQDYPENRCIMHVPSCNDDDHSVCANCLNKLDTTFCVFPFSRIKCLGTFGPPKELFGITCTSCLAKSNSSNPEKRWKCSSCGRVACGLCDEIDCLAEGKCGGSKKAYSRLFSCNGFPLRKNLVTLSMIEKRLKECTESEPWFHVDCPTCSSKIFKTSACNDLRHCGSTSICYYCGQHSFPWEDGISPQHWTNCFRWDVYFPWFQCGDCDTDRGECNLPEHQTSILRLHKERLDAYLKALCFEFPNFRIK